MHGCPDVNHVRIYDVSARATQKHTMLLHSLYLSRHSRYVSHGRTVGISNRLPMIGQPLGPGGRGSRSRRRLLVIIHARTRMIGRRVSTSISTMLADSTRDLREPYVRRVLSPVIAIRHSIPTDHRVEKNLGLRGPHCLNGNFNIHRRTQPEPQAESLRNKSVAQAAIRWCLGASSLRSQVHLSTLHSCRERRRTVCWLSTESSTLN